MNGVRSIQRSANKVHDLINFSTEYRSLRYLRKIKHTGNNKLLIYNTSNGGICVHYKVPLFSFERIKTYVSLGNNRKIIINNQEFEVLNYDKSEIFNLSTVHDTNMLQWLQVFCSVNECRIRNFEVYGSITQDLLYEAHSAFSTQYNRIDQEKYQIYRGN